MRKFFYLFLSVFHKIFGFWFRHNLRVLAYHTVTSPEKFEEQLMFLESNFSIIDIHQLRDFLFHNKELPKKPLLITFDDGDISVLEKGLPLLQKYELPSVLFVITGLINTSKTVWWRRVEKSYEGNAKSYPEARAMVKRLKELPNQERENYLRNIEFSESRQLTEDQLQFLQSSRMFIGNHTHTHPMLNKCNDSEITEEFQAVKAGFEKWKLPGYSTFAYPNGNWDRRTETLLKENGIEIAFLFDHSLNDKKIHSLRISRIAVDAHLELPEFKVKVSGLHPLLLRLKRK